MEFLVDGEPVFAATGGPEFDPALPTLVFVHGAGFDRTAWQLQTRYFAHHGYGVLALDLPGHGRSGGKPIPSIEEIADWLTRVLDAVGAERAALVGHSMGSLASLTAAATHPDRVSKLALLGVAATMPVHPELLEAAESDPEHAIDLIIGWSFGAKAHKGGHPSPGTWMLGSGRRIQHRVAPGVLAADLRACNSFGSATELATRVTCPVLYVLGADDKMTPVRNARTLIDATPDAMVEILPDTGHMMATERPIEVQRALAEFLAS